MTQDDIKSKLDLLFESVKTYRSSQYFRDLMNFCSRFKTMAPYNAMLVRFQMPGANYVLTAREWYNKYHRGIKPNARPLVILSPFGPINFVIDIKYTYPLKNSPDPRTNEQILNELENPYKTSGTIDYQIYHNLLNNLAYHGIAYDPNLNSGASLDAQFKPLNSPSHPIEIYVKGSYITTNADYLLSTSSQVKSQIFAGVVHELGHFFCQHQPAPKNWSRKWEVRKLSDDAKEFEAESVSWLICDRLEIYNPSEHYLSLFLDQNNEIPKGVSIEKIFVAFNKIWDMCYNNNYSYENGLLFKNSKLFQERVKKELEKN